MIKYRRITMKHLVRIASVSPRVHLGNVTKNCEEIETVYRTYAEQVDVIVTPELSLTGYTCGDLFVNRRLIDRAEEGLLQLAKMTAEYGKKGAALVVGVPYEVDGELFNCGAFLWNGTVLALTPKVYLPNYGEFYEKRWFSGRRVENRTVEMADGSETLFGNSILLEMTDPNQQEEHVTFGMEICEDLWTPIAPGRLLALQGAEILLNLSASNEVIGKEQYRRTLTGSMSSSCICGYVYTSAGAYESTSDLVFSGHNLMYENGKLLGEIKPFEDGILIRDFNMTKIRHDRLANKSFAECKRNFDAGEYMTVTCEKVFAEKKEVCARVSMTPFVPSKNRLERCRSIFAMQVAGLQRRIEATHASCIVVGVSGGLDSTLALLVSAQAVKNLGLPPETVTGITMPGFGTTKRTKSNSTTLMELLGCDIREISIVDSVRQHFADIGQDEAVHDITYENCQARERTQILMDVANKEGGFVIGTGDLSELALGWATYNGDHMSMYGVNAGIPKTLVKHLVQWVAENGMDEASKATLLDIVDTPISPELIPADENGEIKQKTEDLVGPYELHDFFLYYFLRFGFRPSKIYFLAQTAFSGVYDDETIKKWLQTFFRRFFNQQFKRSCLPDGPKVGSISISPRGDWRMPSDASSAAWLKEIAEL